MNVGSKVSAQWIWDAVDGFVWPGFAGSLV